MRPDTLRKVRAGILAGLAVAIPLTLCAPAEAQGVRMPCNTAEEVAKQLSTRFSETPVAFGLQSNGNLLQVWSSEEKGTWTVVSTTPDGLSCIVAAGKGWETLPPIVEEPMA